MQDRQILMQITGLNCAGCVGRAEKALAAIPGVTEASVNLATAKGQVQAAQDLEPAALVSALEQAGYPAAVSQLSLDIEGLSCASCVGRAEAALRAVPGVVTAEERSGTDSSPPPHSLAVNPAGLLQTFSRLQGAGQGESPLIIRRLSR